MGAAARVLPPPRKRCRRCTCGGVRVCPLLRVVVLALSAIAWLAEDPLFCAWSARGAAPLAPMLRRSGVWSPPWGCGAWCGPRSAPMHGSAAKAEQAPSRVVDAQRLVAASTLTAITRLSTRVEKATGVKLFVLVPPQDVVRKPDKFSAYLAAQKQNLGMDTSSVVIVVGPDATPDGFIGINRGSKVMERFQFRLTTAHSVSTERAFGNKDYVQKYGYDQAVRLAVENMAACLYLVSEDPSNRECGVFVLPESRVKEVLDAH